MAEVIEVENKGLQVNIPANIHHDHFIVQKWPTFMEESLYHSLAC